MKKIALLWIDPFSLNKGVGALAYSTLHVLEEISRSKGVAFEYYVVGTHHESRSGQELLPVGDMEIPYQKTRCMVGGGLKGFLLSLYFRKELRIFSEFDYVLDISEGDSFSDIYGAGRFHAQNFTKRAYAKRGIKQMLLPQTIGPYEDAAIEKMAIESIEACDTVLARDRQSYEFLRQKTRQKNIDEIIDMAFFLPYEKNVFRDDQVHVGLNVSNLLWHGGYDESNQFGLVVDYRLLIDRIVKYFLAQKGVQLHLVPHVLDTRKTLENDYALSLELEGHYRSDRIRLAPFFLTPVMAKNYIAGMDFFAGARMHSAIAAFSSCVPVFPMAYSRKFSGLFVETLGYAPLGDMVRQDCDNVMQELCAAFENRGDLKKLIRKVLQGKVAERKALLKRHLERFLDLE
ncbi:MAG: polysaccharide pyruvyl transferase family protein [Planctomycetes bacterium]|nr:polysaccharide pyruvyl transferase family protein [Planctomycetota bacterium]